MGPSSTYYFLGANTPDGFLSLYDDLTSPDDFLYILKGGPGCGKSSFMRKLSSDLQKKGFAAEFILCAGDPDSLDGVRFPELGVAFVDGTSPHADTRKVHRI
ncbi:MAG: hypothetical protein AB7C97_11745 [Oscillospiraceae bacterium]